MSKAKAWADYSPAELLEALERTEPRHIGDLYTDADGIVCRCDLPFDETDGVFDSVAGGVELLRVLAERIQKLEKESNNAP